MSALPKVLQQKLDDRIAENGLRKLTSYTSGIDFYSNDYLGLAAKTEIGEAAVEMAKAQKNGSTGSRLISGNYALLEEVESKLAALLGYESSLSYGSGYVANVGFFSCVPQKDDVVLYDKLIHASVHDGLQLSKATRCAFQHNNLEDLESKLASTDGNTVYVVTEAIFSMDGDEAPVMALVDLCEKYGAKLVIDEAHSYGVIGENGEGVVASLNLQSRVFATLYTFGKALGGHGAVWAVSEGMKQYLVNFSRAFIFSTGIAPHQIAGMLTAAEYNTKASVERKRLAENIRNFRTKIEQSEFPFLASNTSIQILKTEDNLTTDNLVSPLTQAGFLVKGIKYPTVPPKSTRIRFCIHAFNTSTEIDALFEQLDSFYRS